MKVESSSFLPPGKEAAAARKIAAGNLCAWAGEHHDQTALQSELGSRDLRGLSVGSFDLKDDKGPQVFRPSAADQVRDFLEACMTAPMARGARFAAESRIFGRMRF